MKTENLKIKVSELHELVVALETEIDRAKERIAVLEKIAASLWLLSDESKTTRSNGISALEAAAVLEKIVTTLIDSGYEVKK